MRPPAGLRKEYRWFTAITTRWMDNNAYGHINNVVYYSFFDTAVNSYLLEAGLLHIEKSPVIGIVAETSCRFFSSLSFPGRVDAGLRVGKIGTSSVRYEIGLFAHHADAAAAEGTFVHVYVDRATRRPRPLTEEYLAALSALVE